MVVMVLCCDAVDTHLSMRRRMISAVTAPPTKITKLLKQLEYSIIEII